MALRRQLWNVFLVTLVTIVALAFVGALAASTRAAPATDVRGISHNPAQRSVGDNWHVSAGDNWHHKHGGDNWHVAA